MLVHQTTLDPSPCPGHRRQEGCGLLLRQVETAQDCCFHGHSSSNHRQTFRSQCCLSRCYLMLKTKLNMNLKTTYMMWRTRAHWKSANLELVLHEWGFGSLGCKTNWSAPSQPWFRPCPHSLHSWTEDQKRSEPSWEDHIMNSLIITEANLFGTSIDDDTVWATLLDGVNHTSSSFRCTCWLSCCMNMETSLSTWLCCSTTPARSCPPQCTYTWETSKMIPSNWMQINETYYF